jgi:hypothetical protein
LPPHASRLAWVLRRWGLTRSRASISCVSEGGDVRSNRSAHKRLFFGSLFRPDTSGFFSLRRSFCRCTCSFFAAFSLRRFSSRLLDPCPLHACHGTLCAPNATWQHPSPLRPPSVHSLPIYSTVARTLPALARNFQNMYEPPPTNTAIPRAHIAIKCLLIPFFFFFFVFGCTEHPNTSVVRAWKELSHGTTIVDGSQEEKIGHAHLVRAAGSSVLGVRGSMLRSRWQLRSPKIVLTAQQEHVRTSTGSASEPTGRTQNKSKNRIITSLRYYQLRRHPHDAHRGSSPEHNRRRTRGPIPGH